MGIWINGTEKEIQREKRRGRERGRDKREKIQQNDKNREIIQ